MLAYFSFPDILVKLRVLVIENFFMNSSNEINYLAIDYGEKYSGVAIYKKGQDPYPLGFGRIRFKNQSDLVAEIQKIISDEFITDVIIGIPYLLDGKSTSMTEKVLAFFHLLKSSLQDTRVHAQDETLSTSAAKDRMMNSAQYNFKVNLDYVDQIAATIILEDFLSQNG
jgi:putative Holliday junction resolvase